MIYCVERKQRSATNNQKHISRENDMVFRTHMDFDRILYQQQKTFYSKRSFKMYSKESNHQIAAGNSQNKNPHKRKQMPTFWLYSLRASYFNLIICYLVMQTIISYSYARIVLHLRAQIRYIYVNLWQFIFGKLQRQCRSPKENFELTLSG